MSNLAILVDESDNIIGTKDRHKLMSGDIIRISALWVENGKGQVLLAKRSLNKKHMPGLWGTAAAGTVEPDETYESNVYKEAEEEIGVSGVTFEFVDKWMYWNSDGKGRYVSAYRALIDKPAKDFIIQEEEVDSVAWFDKADLVIRIKKHPEDFVGSVQSWEKYFLN